SPTVTDTSVAQLQQLGQNTVSTPPQLLTPDNVTSVQPAIQNSVPPLQHPVQNDLSPLQIAIRHYAPYFQAAIQNNGPPPHPSSYYNVLAAQPLHLNLGPPLPTPNFVTPAQGLWVSLRDNEAEDRPHRENRTSLRPSNGSDIHPCSVFMESSTSNIRLTINSDMPRSTLRSRYESTMSLLRERVDPPVKVFVDLGNNASSTHFGYVSNALTRLVSDDAHHRCKYLDVTLRRRGDDPVPPPDVDNASVSLTVPQIQTLVWRSDKQYIPMMNPATLTHLTTLTLRTRISFRDCHYILGCIQNTVQHFDARDLYQGHVNMLPNSYADAVPGLRQLESFSIVATSPPYLLLKHLRLYGEKLKALTIEVPNHVVDPEAMKFIPWATIDNITLKCNFVNGGANWVTTNAVQAASMGGLQLQSP
ncbi:hypothetical protein H0H93_016159, partial [Arthromyces matolae]